MTQMNRKDRRALAAGQRKYVKQFPDELTVIPKEEWGRLAASEPKLVGVLRSNRWLVQLYNEASANFPGLVRMSVCKAYVKTDMKWGDEITWDDLQQLKRESGFGDWYGVEVYPPDNRVVNVANMRHLWLMQTPLPIGWGFV